MNIEKKDRRYLRTQTMLKRQFLNMLEKQPVEKISVTRLCREADVNRTTFYAHYTDVYNLLADIEQDCIHKIMELYEQILNGSDLPEQVMCIVLQYIRENRAILSVILKQKNRNAFWNTINDKIQELFRLKTMQKYQLPRQMSQEQYNDLILFLSNGFYAIYSKWLQNDCSESIDELSEFTTKISIGCIESVLIKRK